MKAMLPGLSLATLIAGGATYATVRATRPLVEPDKILDIEPTSLTTYLPTSSSMQQGVRPRVGQRGTQIDGAVRAETAHGLAIGGNPFAHGSGTTVRANGLRLDQGTAEIFEVDLRLPSAGFDWVVGRSYNARQIDSTGAHQDSSGYQGKNWFQSSNPEVLLSDGDTDDEASDILYLIYGADRFIEFQRVGENKTVFRAVNGAAGVVKHYKDTTPSDGVPGTFVYTDQVGNETYFFDTDSDAGSAQGQFWKVVDPAGNIAYFGHATSASSAISSGYTGGKPWVAYDATGRRFTYTYASDMLTKVEAEVNNGSWVSVGTVEYSYYDGTDGTDGNGSNGDLQQVKITTPLTDNGIELVQCKLYRYWKNNFVTTTNPGRAHAIKLIVGFEGCRKYDFAGDATFDQDYLTETTANLKPYADAYFEYDSSERIVKAYSQGQCDCSGGSGDGVYDYEYETNGSYSDNTAGYDEDEWYGRTVVKRPDDAYETHYYDEAFQPLSHVLTSADPDGASSLWATYVDRNSAGIVTEVSTPANVTAYTHSSGSPSTPVGTFTRSTSAGLVWTYSLVGSSYTTEGFATDRKFKEAGTSGTAYFDRTWTYTYASYQVDGAETKSQVVRPVVANDREYADKISSGTTGSNLWSYAYTWHGASGRDLITLARLDTTQPTVSTTKNGSGSANVTREYFNKDGTLGFEKTALGYITYHGYNNGQQVTLIEDANTSHSDLTGVTIPTNFSSSGTELHRKSTFSYDAQGRPETTTANSYTPKRYYTRLKDHRPVEIEVTHYQTSPSTKYLGPVSYQVLNQAGQAEVSGLIGLTDNETSNAPSAFIVETDDDPIAAVSTGTVKRLTTYHYDLSGHQLSESRVYFAIPLSEPGTDGTHYDPTTYAYDGLRRLIRTEAPHGTIYRNVYDVRSHVTENWVGTNDNGYPSGDASGTANLVRTSTTVFDAGSDKGNGYVTSHSAYVDGSTTDERVTTYTNDAMGRVVVDARPLSPHYVYAYDNLGRRTAVASYSSTSSLSVSTNPTTTSTNRISLTKTNYDQLGRVWRTELHKIDQADGSDDDSLSNDWWYDADSRAVKVDGQLLKKYEYDRLNRLTRECILASDDDTQYVNGMSTSGDVVVSEKGVVYDPADSQVVMQVDIERRHDDAGSGATTGALDTNADADIMKVTPANLLGLVKITSFWHGIHGVTDIVQFGTNGDAVFNRAGLSIPARSATALRTTIEYDNAGAVSSVTDPTIAAPRITKYVYDDAGRRITEILNYDSAVNGGAPSSVDTNMTTRAAYVDGLVSSITRDLPSGYSDLVTEYTYGTTIGSHPASQIATGHLLYQVEESDSRDSDDVTLYSYNAQEELVRTRERQPSSVSGHVGSVVERDRDLIGRTTALRISTLGTDIDGWVRAIRYGYDLSSRLSTVTQYSDPSSQSSTYLVNQNKFSYDDWGETKKSEFDANSAVDASGSVDDYEFGYNYGKATQGGNVIRLIGHTMSRGTSNPYKSLTYTYSTQNYDGDCSRVTQIKEGSTVLAAYTYLGLDRTVGEVYPVQGIYKKRFNASTGDYSDLDRFGRVVEDRWTKNLSTDVDFYHTTLHWNERSQVIATEDNVHSGFDRVISFDGVDRIATMDDGDYASGSIASNTVTRSQEWTRSHRGTWDLGVLDLNGDGDYIDSSELNETRTHATNSDCLATRDLDSNAGTTSNNLTMVWNVNRELVDDGSGSKFEYDAFHRVRKVLNQADAVVEVIDYDGLGNVVARRFDNDDSSSTGSPDGVVDSNDHEFRTVAGPMALSKAVFRDDDTSPKLTEVGGFSGISGPSGFSKGGGALPPHPPAPPAPPAPPKPGDWLDRYLGRLTSGWALDRELRRLGFFPHRKFDLKKGGWWIVAEDQSTSWLSQSDGTLETGGCVLGDDSGNVVAYVSDAGELLGGNRYTCGGMSFSIPTGDVNSDGSCTASDILAIENWGSAPYDVRADPDLDGDIDINDAAFVDLSTGGYFSLMSGFGGAGAVCGFGGAVADPVMVPAAWSQPNGATYLPEVGVTVGSGSEGGGSAPRHDKDGVSEAGSAPRYAPPAPPPASLPAPPAPAAACCRKDIPLEIKKLIEAGRITEDEWDDTKPWVKNYGGNGTEDMSDEERLDYWETLIHGHISAQDEAWAHTALGGAAPALGAAAAMAPAAAAGYAAVKTIGTAAVASSAAGTAVTTGTVAVTAGTRLYRVWGGGSGPLGHFWSTVNPYLVTGYRNLAGLPDTNTGQFVSSGVLRSIQGVTTGTAARIGNNLGGLVEVIVPSPKLQIEIDFVTGMWRF